LTGHRPEENIHYAKLRRLERVIDTYLLEKSEEREWVIDALMVYLDMEKRSAHCEFIENIV